MAEVRTLKNGRLYLLADGSAFNDFASVDVSTGTLFQKADGAWSSLIAQGNAVRKFDGGTPASIQQTSPSALFSETNPIFRLATYATGANVYAWYGYDETGTGVHDLRVRSSTNSGTSFGSSTDLNVVGDATWCNDDIWPVYFEYQGATATSSWLWCMGLNGSTYTLGRVLVAHAGTFATDIANPANYAAEPSGILTLPSLFYVAMTKHGGQFHLYTGDDTTPSTVRYRRGLSATNWTNPVDVFSAGANTTNDDALTYPLSAHVYQNVFHLLYRGNDGTANRALLAVGESPEKLHKVPMVDTALFASTNSELVSYASDLTFSMPDLSIHIPDRLKPGSLRDGAFEPQTLAFTLRQVGTLDATDTGLGYLLNGPTYQVGDDSAKTMPKQLPRLNVCYVIEDSDGNPEGYYLWPYCTVQSVQVQEGIEGNTINATLRCESMRRPLYGSVE